MSKSGPANHRDAGDVNRGHGFMLATDLFDALADTPPSACPNRNEWVLHGPFRIVTLINMAWLGSIGCSGYRPFEP